MGENFSIVDMMISKNETPFYAKPDPIEVGNKKTSLNNQGFAYREILSIIEMGCYILPRTYSSNYPHCGNKPGWFSV